MHISKEQDFNYDVTTAILPVLTHINTETHTTEVTNHLSMFLFMYNLFMRSCCLNEWLCMLLDVEPDLLYGDTSVTE